MPCLPAPQVIGLSGTAITFLGTAFTAFAYGIGNFALRPEFYEKVYTNVGTKL